MQQFRIDPSSHIEAPSQLPLETSSALSTLFALTNAIIGRLNGKLSHGPGTNLKGLGNMLGTSMEVTTPATPDEDFTLVHDLGYTPNRCVIVLADKAAAIYLSPVLVRDERTITLRCDVASAALTLEIY